VTKETYYPDGTRSIMSQPLIAEARATASDELERVCILQKSPIKGVKENYSSIGAGVMFLLKFKLNSTNRWQWEQ